MAVQRRYVDSLPSLKTRHNVEVINMGLSRTGTMSFYQALQKLGYTSYHMSEACMSAGKGHLTMWNEAISAKHGSSQLSTYNSADFDKLLVEYNALTDAPCVLFIPELLAAYPDARLVLTIHPRGVDRWLQSMENSYFRITSWSIWSRLMMVHDKAFSLPYMTLLRRIMELWTETAWPEASDFPTVRPRLRTFYLEHNDEMRKLARDSGRELLEFDPSKGWEPLCKYLGKDVPSEPYPHANEGNHVLNLHKYILFLRMRAVFGPTLAKILGGAALAVIAWWCARR